MGQGSSAGAPRRSSGASVGSASAKAAGPSPFAGESWFENAKNRVLGNPDLAAAAAVLSGLENDDARRRVGQALLSYLVPVYPDLEVWTTWATHGGPAPDKKTWAVEKRVNGKSRARRNMSRAIACASARDADEAALRSQIAELTAQADAIADEAEAYRDQARAFTIIMLDISLQSSISQVYSMGAGYVVLKAIAQTGRGQTLLAQIDAWSTDAGFLETMGTAIAGVVDRQLAAAGKAPQHRYATGGDRTKTFLNALPEGVDAASLRDVLSTLIPDAHSQHESEEPVRDVVPYETMADVLDYEPLPFAAEDYSAMDVLHQDANETAHSVDDILEQRVTMAAPLVHGKAKPARSKALSAGGEDASLFTAPLPVVSGIEADSADGDDDDRIPGF